MLRAGNKFKDNLSVMYKSVGDLILANKSLIGKTKFSIAHLNNPEIKR